MNLFYVENITGSTAVMSEMESRHCVKSMRLRNGDSIRCTDGNGFLYDGVLVEDNPKACVIAIRQQTAMPPELPFHLHIAVAATKNPDRLEWFVEKAVEIGVTEISIIRCAHSEKESVKTDRMERLMIAAMKQSLRFRLPAFHPAIELQALVQQYAPLHDWQKFIAYCGEENDKQELISLAAPQTNSLILIGPEGDFSPDEVVMAQQSGFRTVTFGSMRLRTETAALYACCQMHFVNELKKK